MISGISSNFSSMSMSNSMRKQGPPPPPPDGAGKLNFDDLDSDSSGSIKDSELDSFSSLLSEKGIMEKSVSEILSDLDSDGNGEISSSEFEEGGKNRKPNSSMMPLEMNNMRPAFMDGLNSSDNSGDLSFNLNDLYNSTSESSQSFTSSMINNYFNNNYTNTQGFSLDIIG